MRRLLSGLMALLLTGCWHDLGGSYVADDFPRHRITTVAVLPVINKTEQPMATAAVAAAVTRQLVNEKHYRVLPMASVMHRLKSGGGGAAFVQLMNLLNLGQEPTPQLFHEMAVALDADALLQETVVAYHHLREDVVGATAGGAAGYQQVPVTIVEVQGVLWGERASSMIWRDHAMQRYYHDTATEGDGSATPVVELATHQLLAHLPENTWAPQK